MSGVEIKAYGAKHSPIPDADRLVILAFYLDEEQVTTAAGIQQANLSQLLQIAWLSS
ncbi:hypothetical protein [Deinococcus rubellus]|uniref:hypothetical protein n=1 Tax=Deinococcus rubellus TaxID=1889240 RepID=UPI0031E80DAE